jgi:hypothetical protein
VSVTTPGNEVFDTVRDGLLRDGARYIVISHLEREHPPIHLFAYSSPQFLDRFTEKVYEDGLASVYRIKDP